MTTAHRPPGVSGPAVSPRRVLPVLAAVAVLVAVGCITLGPPGAVADARRTLMAGVEVLAAPWPGAVQRAQVEAVANALLFVPVGALAALALRGRGPVLPVLLGAGASVLVELAQTALPGRVPDPVDVVANTVGTALGVGLATVLLALSRRAAVRERDVRRPHRGALAALVAVPLVIAGVTGCGDLTAEDGWLRDGEVLSPFDDVPALTRLDGALRTAVQDAYREAAADGVRFHVTTGWRSAAYQQALFDDAVEQYGSPEAARARVLRADESTHVTGDAVDIGPTEAMYWLSRHGSDFGLCQTYANEVWHFELAVERGGECPAPVADSSAG